jgi:DNA-binding transcriptional ArsR family regulator
MATAILQAKRAGADDTAVLRTRQIQRAASLLKHVSDPTRLQVLGLLSERERHVGELCEALTRRSPAVCHHLTLLRLGGLIDRRRQGQKNIYSLTATGERLSKIVKVMAR